MGGHGRQDDAGLHDGVPQGVVHGLLVLLLVRGLAPGPVPHKADVPSGEVLHDVVGQGAGELVELPGLHERCCLGDHLLGPGDHPAVLVPHVGGDVGEGVLRGVVSVDQHVGAGEVDDVPEGVDDLPGVLRAVLLEGGVLPGGVGHYEIVPQGIGSDLVDDLQGLDDVPERLGHLLSLGVEDPSVHHDLVVRCAVEGDHTGSQLGIEPSAGLVVRLDDESRGPPLVELGLVPRVSQVGPGGDTGVEPYVQDVRDPVHGAAALGAGECDAVDPGAVGVHAVGVTLALLELLVLSDDPAGSAGALPDGHGDPPVPLPGDAPFPGAFHPVPFPGGSGPVGDPFDAVDLVEHLLLDLGYGDEPLAGVPVDDW